MRARGASPRNRRGTDRELRRRGRPGAVRALLGGRDPGPHPDAGAADPADLVTAPDDTCIATSDARPLARAPLPARRRDAARDRRAGARRERVGPLPGGLIVQWGLVTPPHADVAVAFGTAFPGSCLGVWAQPVAGAAAALYAAQVSDVASPGSRSAPVARRPVRVAALGRCRPTGSRWVRERLTLRVRRGRVRCQSGTAPRARSITGSTPCTPPR